MVKNMGDQMRVKVLKEEMGILAYMRRNNLENQGNKGNPELMVREFSEQTAIHPCLEAKPLD